MAAESLIEAVNASMGPRATTLLYVLIVFHLRVTLSDTTWAFGDYFSEPGKWPWFSGREIFSGMARSVSALMHLPVQAGLCGDTFTFGESCERHR
ncbi:hypothetical protein [Xaviernesmea oryzae]|uniref:hypothetical protein n=1 Tax=Xaviernesmea oryzae TaxID=464029 RepID=UPI000A7BFFBC|nr:hypothetical protein [Xaviernesmea oryzae]